MLSAKTIYTDFAKKIPAQGAAFGRNRTGKRFRIAN